MLERLIAILNRNGSATLDQIALELDTTPEMIEQLIAHLERNNLLKQIGDNCQATCSGCYLASACGRSPSQRIWSSIN
jgi:Mn-dependent DtxR family transcriptional regulator